MSRLAPIANIVDTRTFELATSSYHAVPDDGICASSPGIPGQSGSKKPTTGLVDLGDFNIQEIKHQPGFFMSSLEPHGTLYNNYLGEAHLYRLMTKILHLATEMNPEEGPQVLDAGGNQGFYALAAAVSGARFVYSVEPQPNHQKAIRLGARLSSVDERIFIYPNAVFDKKMTLSIAGDRGGAHIAVGKRGLEVKAIRLDKIVRHLPDQPVAFLKIDIEGFEVQGIRSASGLFEQKLVRNVVVEWGPPARWKEFHSTTVEDAILLLDDMHNLYGFELGVMPSIGFPKLLAAKFGTAVSFGSVSQMIKVDKSSYGELMTLSEEAGELYLWFYQPHDKLNKALFDEVASEARTYDAAGKPTSS
ncbi:hypothetical protein HKX48_007220 [Thoreauomyces humboldtii]|nr:hypothetical protein HKX48_007220 [Thoreauomyces humboldtii]